MISTGVDCLYIWRVERAIGRFGVRFSRRILTPAERELATSARFTAGRFSAKEAIAKALGTGIWREDVSFQDIEILPDARGKLRVTLSGGAKAAFSRLGGHLVSVSLSHEKDIVVAMAVLEHDVESL